MRRDVSEQEVELALHGYFADQASRLRAPAGVWGKLAPRLDAKPVEEQKPRRLPGVRFGQGALVPALATFVLMLLVGGGTWTLMARPWEPGFEARALRATATDTPTPLPTSTESQYASPTSPPEAASPNLAATGAYSTGVTITLAPTSVSGIGGPSGPAGAAGTVAFTVADQDTSGRQVAFQASLTLESQDADGVANGVRAAAESAGGYVQQLSTSGAPGGRQASVTVRVPQAQFYPTLERIEALGKVTAKNVGSEDVTGQAIDLEARLRSAQREEASYLALLDKTTGVGDVLTVERELSRVRSDIERTQGELSFLKRRIDMATIAVSVAGPKAAAGEAPSATLTLRVRDVALSASAIRAAVSAAGGEVDRATSSVQDGRSRADMSARVFARDFTRVLASMEGTGKVVSETVNEGKASSAQAAQPGAPDARIDLSLIESEPFPSTLSDWMLYIGVPAGAALLVLIGALLFATYRAGRRAGRSG